MSGWIAPPDRGTPRDEVPPPDSELYCPFCVRDPNLGSPSYARWIGPDGYRYCSLHFIHTFGHGEKLIRIEDYVPPSEPKPPAP